MDDRRKALELLAKGKISSEKLINPNQDVLSRALESRNLTQSALAKQVLDNTGIPIPSKNAKVSQLEDFYNRLGSELYPELKKVDVNMQDLTKENANGIYYPGKDLKWIELQKGQWAKNPEQQVGTLLHELGHQYDDEVLNKKGNPISEKLKLPKDMNADDAYEIISNKHHVDYIPGKREVGSFGKGALQSLMKNGTFRTVTGSLPLAGGLAAAAASGDASAAVPILGEAESVGESVEQERELLNEIDARKNYDGSQARRDALRKLGER